MQLNSLMIRDCFRDVVGSISVEELICNKGLAELLTKVEALFRSELGECC